MEPKQTDVNILLFENFTALDVFGPVEVLGSIDGYNLRYRSRAGGIVTNGQHIRIETEPTDGSGRGGILLVPGGWGTRALVGDEGFLSLLKEAADGADFCLSVCTGSALLAKCGALDGKKAATNRRAFDWVASQSGSVLWQKDARFVHDGKFWSSAGVSAGIDMALAFVAEQFGTERAAEIAERMEYRWSDI